LAFSVLGSSGDKSIVHILITSCGPQGFQVQEQENQTARTFQSLHEIVDFYSIFLQIPFNSEVPFEGYLFSFFLFLYLYYLFIFFFFSKNNLFYSIIINKYSLLFIYLFNFSLNLN